MSRILDQHGNPFPALAAPAPAAAPAARPVTTAQNNRMLRARFDSQFTTEDNKRHWAMADGMSIDASASWMVRRILRMRSRYEYHNNSYYFGIADTVANYVIGTGPRLQMLTPDKRLNGMIEQAWSEWSEAVCLADTLKSMRMARLVNGESFSLLRTNPNIDHPVKLDVFEVEADQVSSPMFGLSPQQYPDQYFDGVILDPYGRPQEYHVLRQHPGAFGAFVIMGYVFDKWPARYVLHDYKRVRPGQQRGIPETTPCLELFADLRRYRNAVIGAAEVVAENALTIESDAPADPDAAGAPDPMDVFKLQPRQATVLPQGWKMNQTKAEQPTTTFEMFTNAILREISRCLNLPVVFASLDATQANMSSSYIVTQPFAKSVQVDRAGYNRLLNRVFDEFLTEALRIPGLLPPDMPDAFPHHWMWPSIGNHADPMKVAMAQQTELANGATTLPREYAKHGLDWEEEMAKDAESMGVDVPTLKSLILQKRFGIPAAVPGAGGAPTAPASPNTDNDDSDEDDAQPTDDDA